MDNVSSVHIVATRQYLEHKVLQMVVCQILSRVDHSVHISLHQFSDDVDILIPSHIGRLGHIKHLDNVLVVKEFEQANLSHNSLGVNKILESFWHFFDRDFAMAYMIVGTANHTVRSMTDLLDVLKFFLDAESRA